MIFTRAIQEAGAARVSVVAGTAPFAAVIVALVFLHEPFRAPVIIGGVVIVLGGLLLAAEKGRPGHVKTIGLFLGVLATTLFAVRDNLVRAIHAGASPETASVAILFAGVLVSSLWARQVPTRVELRRMAPAGILFGLSYLALFEAYFHGRVEIVSPLTATESFDVEVGRVRESLVFAPCGLDLFVCGDQLLRGAALNAVQIAELL